MKILAIAHRRQDALQLEEHCRAILLNRLEFFDTADSLASTTDRLRDSAFDVALLDPELADADGLVLLANGTLRGSQTIVLSARADLAVRAFDHGALDFVQKPAGRERLAKALLRVLPLSLGAAASAQFIAVRRFGRIEFIAVEDLLYVEGSDKYSELVLANGQRSFYDKCLGRLEATLPRSFVRIHKSFLVRFPMISRLHVQRGSRYFAELKNGQRLPVGRSRYAQIKSRLI